tara:strand:- start:553 stop:915 length:363 start_codon:yes stop_codon:yes gene_type:complete
LSLAKLYPRLLLIRQLLLLSSVTIIFSRYFTDSASVSEQSSLNVGKPLADAGLVADQQTLATGKGLAEAPAVQEQAAFNVAKPVSDTLTTADSGLILMQDYVEVTGSYFLEDYVGTSQII